MIISRNIFVPWRFPSKGFANVLNFAAAVISDDIWVFNVKSTVLLKLRVSESSVKVSCYGKLEQISRSRVNG